MTKKKRTFLFISCLVSFLIIAPLVVLYSQGYRFNPKTRTVTQTGAFYVKTLPKSCNIYIDGKLKGKTDFFFGADLIENLVPDTYFIELKKQGYLSWQKNFKVKAMMTTEAKNVILFPDKLSLQDKTSNVQSIFPSPLANILLLEKKGSQGWYLTSFDLKSGLEEILFSEKDFDSKRLGSKLIDLTWSNDAKKAIAKVLVGEKESFFLLEINSQTAPFSLDALGSFEKISFQDNDSFKFFLLKSNILYNGDFASLKIRKLAEKIIDFAAKDDKLYYLDDNGFVFRSDDPTNLANQKLTELPIVIVPEISYELIAQQHYLFLKQENALFWLDQANNQFAKIAESATDFAVAPDNNKVVYLNNTEIYLYFFEAKIEQIEEQPNQNILLARFSEPINQVSWLNNDYLIFSLKDKLKASEIDSRDQANIVDLLTENDISQFYYDKNNKKALILNQGNLQLSGQIVP